MEQNPNKSIISKILSLCLGILAILFLIGIIWINLNSGLWYDYDIYSDAMVARYMSESHSLFPENWVFGNQLYVIATPVLASLIYGICQNTVISLGIASCLMTILTVSLFLWCIWPFTKKYSRIVGVFCIIGGTLFSSSATNDSSGLQIFFTMASYYSCYLIGILLTLGIWLRLYSKSKVALSLWVICALVNITLSMQSLREMLVLNIPLCAVAIFLNFIGKKDLRSILSKDCVFALSMLAAALIGYIAASMIPVNQSDILTPAGGNIIANVIDNAVYLRNFIGLRLIGSFPISVFRFVAAAVLFTSFIYSTVSVIKEFIKSKTLTPLSCGIIFCIVSLAAVFFAGVFIINSRPIYFFVWHLSVALSVMYTLEKLCKIKRFTPVFLAVLIIIGTGNLYSNFKKNIDDYSEDRNFCKEVADTLVNDGITYVYYDVSAMFGSPRLATYSNDKIIFSAVELNMSNYSEGDLLNYIDHLYSKDWLDIKNTPTAYFLTSGERLKELSTEESAEFNDALFKDLTEKYRFTYKNIDYYFYSFTDELLYDIINR